MAELAPDAPPTRSATWPSPRSHPRWVVSALPDALGGDLGRGRPRRWPPTTTARRSTSSPGPAGSPATSCSRPPGPRPSPAPCRRTPYGCPAAASRPRSPRSAAAGPPCRTRAASWPRSPSPSAPLEGRDEVWLDLSAGPGGKAGLLAGLAAERGAVLIANEVAPHRAKLVGRALAGLGQRRGQSSVTGSRRPGATAAFDRVLLDAPCTGLGALRRRPEARWRRQPEDLAGLGPLQRALLDTAIALGPARRRGRLRHLLAAPRRDPGRGRRRAQAHTPGSSSSTPGRCCPASTELGDGPAVQLWPHRHGTDAMFICLLRVP